MVRVLVVDDNVDAADTLAVVLTLWGHEPQVAYHGARVLPLAQEFRPHVILLDLGLPGVNGLDIARQVRQAPELSGVRLVAVTGFVRDVDRHRAIESGFDEHWGKPINLDLLQDYLAGLDPGHS